MNSRHIFRFGFRNQLCFKQIRTQAFRSSFLIYHNQCRIRSKNVNPKLLLSYWNKQKSLYDILNVPKTATAKEIKLAYFREAKKHHPDLNPDNPSAKAKFQEISAAYEILSDEQKRRSYDMTGETTNNQQTSQQQQHYEDIFNSVQQDLDIIKDALQSYYDEIRDDMTIAIDSLKRGDWGTAAEIAKSHRILIVGVVLPTFLLVRYPPLVLAGLRLIWAGSNVLVGGLVYTGKLEYASKLLWKKIVKLSLERKKRNHHKY